MASEEIRTEVQKLILEEMTLFAREHREEIVRRALAKWKNRQPEKAANDDQTELPELD